MLCAVGRQVAVASRKPNWSAPIELDRDGCFGIRVGAEITDCLLSIFYARPDGSKL
jgi:hypothetical protein